MAWRRWPISPAPACSGSGGRSRLGPFWQYLELGRYGAQLEHLFDRDQVLVLLYRDLREEPVETLDRVCDFLGVKTGLLDEVPTENVTAHVEGGIVNQALHRGLQGLDVLGNVAPPLHRAAQSLGAKLPQREQRTRPALTTEERCLRLPHYYEDLAILEKQLGRSFARWRDPENSRQRRSLDINGRFGTGFTSIDRPDRAGR